MTRRWPGGWAARCLATLVFVGWSGVLLVWPAAPAAAHPLGDFTVNTHVGIRVEPAAVALDVVVDIAEVPTLRAFPALRATSGAPDRTVPEADQRAYRDRLCPALRQAVAVRLGGRPVELKLVDSSLRFLPGDAGLATARLECALRSLGDLSVVGQELTVTDNMAVQPVGWREITAVGDGVELARSSVPSRSPSEVLRDYPEDKLDDPLDHREARLHVVAGSGVVTGRTADTAPDDRPALSPSTLASSLADLVGTRQLSVGFGLAAIALAVVLGSLHAFAPGHGKTLMAAYLVGRNGTLRQAALIGASVTVTHTAGVLVLGVLVSVAVVSAPERIYSWMSLASGLLLVAIGLALLRAGWRRWLSGDSAHEHDHGHGHGHGHLRGPDDEPGGAHRVLHDGGPRAPGTSGRTDAATLTVLEERAPHRHAPLPLPLPLQPAARRGTGDIRSLLAVGFAGGLVPSPSAVVVLLGGVALGRAWFGVLLVLAYGIGMALALVGAGLLLVRARDVTERWFAGPHRAGRATEGVRAVARALPLITAGLVVVVGIGVTGQALARL